nr:hypothetical protein [Nocardioides gansuensis]
MELPRELFELVDALGYLGLFLVDEQADAIVRARTVRTTPHGEELGDLIAAQSHSSGPMHEKEVGR